MSNFQFGNETFWLLLIGLSLLSISIAIGRYFRFDKARPIHRTLVIFVSSITLALALTLLSPFIKDLVDAMFRSTGAGGTQQPNDQAQFAIAIVSFLTAALAGYATYIIANFESKREKVEQQTRDLEKRSEEFARQLSAIDATYRPSLEEGRRNNEINEFLLARTASFLYILDEIDGLEREILEDEQKWKSLKLLQKLLSRNDLADIRFDLDEIVALLHDGKHYDQVRQVIGLPVQDYLRSFVKYYKLTGSSDAENDLTKLHDLAEHILCMVRY